MSKRATLAAIARLILVVHLFLSPLLFWTGTVEQFEYPKVAILLTAAIVLGAVGLSALAQSAAEAPAAHAVATFIRRGRSVGREPIAFGVLLFAASAIASTLTSVSPRTSFFGAHESFAGLCTILAYAVLFFATRALCRTPADGRRLLAGSVTAAGLVSTYALVQIAQLDPSSYLRVDRFGDYVPPFATLGNSNFLASFLVMTFPITAYFIHGAASQHRRIALDVFLSVGILSWVVVILALSRGAWVALACSVAVLTIGWSAAGERRRAVVLTSVIPLTVVVAMLLVVILGRQPLLASLAERARHFTDDAGRWPLWRAGIRIFLENPMFGSGLDTFQLAFQRQRTMEFFVAPTKAHNEAIHVLATQGLFGAGAMAVLTIGLILASVRAWHRTVGNERLFVIALCAGIVGFYVQNLFSCTVAGCGTLFMTFAGLLSRLGGTQPEPQRQGAVTPSPRLGRRSGQTKTVNAKRRPRWVRLVRVGISGGAAFALFELVLLPIQANKACRKGVDLMLQEPARAVEEFQHAVALDPSQELYWVKLGMAAQSGAKSANQPEERRQLLLLARRAFKRAIELVPTNASAHAELGRILSSLVRDRLAVPAQAFAEFDAALRLDGKNPYHYAAAGNIALALGDLAGAKHYGLRGIELVPRFGPTRALLAQVAARENRLEEAVQLLRQAIELEWHDAHYEGVIARLTLAEALTKLQRFEEAVMAYREAVGRAAPYPEQVEAHFQLAAVLEQLGKRDEAIAEYEQVVTLKSDHPRAGEALRRIRGNLIAGRRTASTPRQGSPNAGRRS